MTPIVVLRAIPGLISAAPWTLEQLNDVRDLTDPEGRWRGPQAVHGTLPAGWKGASATDVGKRRTTAPVHASGARPQARLPLQVRQRLLDAIHASHPFRTVLRELRLTRNQVWGVTKTDAEWSAAAEAALTATRRDDLKHWTNAAYVALRLQGV